MKYAAMRREMVRLLEKRANEPVVISNSEAMEPIKPPKGPARVLGEGLAGMALGMGAGYAIPAGLDYLSRRRTGSPISPSKALNLAPFVGGALGLATPLFHYALMEKMKDNHQMRKKIEQAKLDHQLQAQYGRPNT